MYDIQSSPEPHRHFPINATDLVRRTSQPTLKNFPMIQATIAQRANLQKMQYGRDTIS